jgi:hypothetical protein
MEKDQELSELLLSTDSNFIYFNYLKKTNQINENVKSLLKFDIINLRSESTTGQSRRGKNLVDEILLTNMKPSVNY